MLIFTFFEHTRLGWSRRQVKITWISWI